MESAIVELRVKLETYETNGPIWRAEGNLDQAAACDVKAESIRQAITALEAALAFKKA